MNKILFDLMSRVNKELENNTDIVKIFEGIFSESEHYSVQIIKAGHERMNPSEELARDIPSLFKEKELEKCSLQFYLSAVMHIVDICMFECKSRDIKSFTDKNLMKLPIVIYLNKK
jgi:hypothetical protein